MNEVTTRKRWIAELLLVCVAAGWGIGFPVMKQAVALHPVLMVLGLRFLLSTLLMLPFSAKSLAGIGGRTYLAGISLGLLLGAAFVFLILGLQTTTASNTGFLAGLAVVWVLLLSGPLAGKLPSASAIIAVLFGVAGLLVMSDMHDWHLQWGDSLVIIGSVFTALHILALDKLSVRHNNTALTFLQVATMAAVIMLMQHATGGEWFPQTWDGPLVWALLVTALFSTVIAFWVQTHYQRYTSPTRAVLIYNLEPVFSALFAVWLLHESLSVNVLLGGALILTGMCMPGLISVLAQRFGKEKVPAAGAID
ncbi:DMT family transporter [Erwinia sp. S43]|uniref:DMT family transporter n=1 Tax=Erwinia sp. S43 TaxID=2769339 RepID=UPI00190B04D1|nr:DMT family transporter [Erwinia sp. S43]MBK0033735.1 DMT family transporter [Erwinia sp. S43]